MGKGEVQYYLKLSHASTNSLIHYTFKYCKSYRPKSKHWPLERRQMYYIYRVWCATAALRSYNTQICSLFKQAQMFLYVIRTSRLGIVSFRFLAYRTSFFILRFYVLHGLYDTCLFIDIYRIRWRH